MLYLGFILIAFAVGLAIAFFMVKRKYGIMQATPTQLVSELEMLIAQGETRPQVAEVKGRVVCEHPLISPLAEVPCVYYAMRVSWEYEEIFYEDTGDGKRLEHKREGEETLAEEKQSVLFYVRDASGSLKIDPDGAELITQHVLSRHETDEGIPDSTVRMGRFAMTAPWSTSEEEQRPLMYHFEEEAIPVDAAVYVLGEVTQHGGELRLQRPQRGGRYLISVKREEQLLALGRRRATLYLVGAILSGIAGLVLIAMAMAGEF